MVYLYYTRLQNALLIMIVLTGAIISLATITGDSKLSQRQMAFGQGSLVVQSNNTIDTFSAKGTISSLAAGTLVGSNSTLGSHSADLFVLGGGWDLGVTNGSLLNFNAEILMTKFDGSGKHTHYINMKNATGAVPPITNREIVLTNGGNFTDFMGTADISTDGKTKWNDVPTTVHLLNGNIINIMVNPIQTDYHFKALPIYGTVLSIVDQNGNKIP